MMSTADLRAWRARRRWTQAEAADALGYSRRGYQDAEVREGFISRKIELLIAALEAREAMQK